MHSQPDMARTVKQQKPGQPKNWPFPAKLPPGPHDRIKRQPKPQLPDDPAPF
jgi:hypothetical protein